MSLNSNTEIEAKFQTLDNDIVAEWSSATTLFDTYRAGAAHTEQVRDRYFDSDDFALLRRGYSLRIRTTNSHDGDAEHFVTLKTLLAKQTESLTERGEWEEPFVPKGSAPYHKQWPSSIRKRIAAIASIHAWRTIVQIEQNRTKRMLTLLDHVGPADPSIELSLDTVKVLDPHTGTTHPPLIQFNELELELVATEKEHELQDLVRRLKKQGHAKSKTGSKFESALLEVSAAFPATADALAPTQADLPITEFCRGIWREQMIKIALLEHGVRADTDIEYVHDMRVTTRRARVAMRLFGPYFESRRMRKFAKIMRQLARRLGRVRDFDVSLTNVNKDQQKNEDCENTQAIDKVMQQWRTQRQRMHQRLVDFLDSAEYATFVADFSDFCSRSGLGVKQSAQDTSGVMPTLTRHVLPLLIWQSLAHVRAYEPHLATPEQVPNETLHNLRLACKRLRYILEFTDPLLETRLKRYLARLKDLQELLGVPNDSAVEMERLRKLARKQPELQSRIAYLENSAAQFCSQLAPAYGRIVGKQARKNLAGIIAEL